jgi:hypothetical protein
MSQWIQWNLSSMITWRRFIGVEIKYFLINLYFNIIIYYYLGGLLFALFVFSFITFGVNLLAMKISFPLHIFI